jgi:hypothetical protein
LGGSCLPAAGPISAAGDANVRISKRKRGMRHII